MNSFYYPHAHTKRKCGIAFFNNIICFISGVTEVSTTPETPCEENNTHILSSSQGEKIHAFVQDSLDAHEEFLLSQSTQGPNEHPQNIEHVEAEQPGQGLQREQLEKDEQDKSQIKQPVREEKEGVDPEHSAQEQESIAGNMSETEEVEENKHQNLPCGIQCMRNEAEREQATNTSEQFEKKQASLMREAGEVVPAHGPGPLVTELEDAEQLETIHLPLHHRSLRIDDLPDLEDVDTEDFTAMFSSQQALKPKIEVISGGSDEEEPSGYQSEGIPAFGPDKNSLFLMSGCNKSAGVSNKSPSFVYPEDEDALEPLIFEPVGESKTSQTSSTPNCLIEELE